MKKTAGSLPDFTEGWAFIWPYKKAHNWDHVEHYENWDLFSSRCGLAHGTTTLQKPALKEGTWPRCKLCKRNLKLCTQTPKNP